LPGSGRAGAVEPVVPVLREVVIEGSVLLVEDEEPYGV